MKLEHGTTAGVEFATSFEYLSLIFIVLTLVAGAYYSPVLPGAPLFTNDPVTAKEVGKYSTNRLFVGHSAKLRGSVVQAILAVLTRHDVKADISIYTDGPRSDVREVVEGNFAVAVARSLALSRKLLAAGVPSDAFSITVIPVRRTVPVVVRFSEAAHAD